jgi:diguanylate cyclase (GGDEF)-like protein
MLQKLFRNLSTPGALPPTVVLITGIVAMAAIFIIDLLAPKDVRLHMLYVFPLAAIALHCERKSAIIGALALSSTFQAVTFFFEGISGRSYATDALIALSTAVVMAALARATRQNHLVAVNLATSDWLTGLHNRRSFETVADLEIKRQQRYGGVFSLAVIDLDGFKRLNDSKGHHAGDSALQILADVLREHIRQSDTIARIGGDEFAILMPHTKTPDCSALCQQFCVKVADRMAAAQFEVTVSVGCKAFEQAPESVSHALRQADEAMYAAKAAGKNRAVSL